ncbi:hypothetical protein ACFX5Q_34435 [Mesorhizobium sp. IMUNJ 23033]|uniref:hypothetical protein n=1 Tax=Mesorhizobium sp. IMUNJ 23033 TaxID=3378039 RepID=UPI00384BF0F6
MAVKNTITHEAGLPDFNVVRKAMASRQNDLYFVGLDLLDLNGHEPRDTGLTSKRSVIPRLGSIWLIFARQFVPRGHPALN